MALNVWQRHIVTNTGKVIPDAEVEVFEAGTVTNADLFSDKGGNTALTNPFNAGPTDGQPEGFARFYVAPGRYDIKVTGGGDTITWEDVPVGDLGWGQNPESQGAVGDGVTDDREAFNAVEALEISPVFLTRDYLLSTGPAEHNVYYELRSDASVTLGTGSWNPRRYRQHGVTPFDRKVNFLADNPGPFVEDYTKLPDSYHEDKFWINEWGYQEPDTTGKLSGSTGLGNLPPGQSRLARTASYQLNLRGQHSGQGDGYNLFASMAVSQHADIADVIYWSGQNSGGVINYSVQASTAKVNLYGAGDCELKDNGESDVAMLGSVLMLNRTGADTGDYEIPRFNYYAISKGTGDIDAAYIAEGNYTVGLDLSPATFSADFAVTLASGQKIGYDAPAVVAGKFSTASGGTYYHYKSGSALVTVVANNPTQSVFESRVEVNPDTQSEFTFRVGGSSATAFAAMGQFNTLSYLSAATSGSEATQLILRACDPSGVETEMIRLIGSTGRIRLPTIPTFADDTAAGSGGLVAGDIYQTSTGEMRIKT